MLCARRSRPTARRLPSSPRTPTWSESSTAWAHYSPVRSPITPACRRPSRSGSFPKYSRISSGPSAASRRTSDARFGHQTIHRPIVDGEFVTSGNFHAIRLAAGMDALAMALVQAAELAAQHIHRLLDHRFSGLPDQLAGRPGPHAGLIVVHKRAVGTLNEVRRLAMPASVGLMDTSLGQEDAMTFAYEAAEKLRRVETLVREVVACELFTAYQAFALGTSTAAAGLSRHIEL